MKEELIKRAEKAESVDELMALCNAEGIELERNKAEMIYSRLRSNELSDDLLSFVSGGTGESEVDDPYGGACYGYTGPA